MEFFHGVNIDWMGKAKYFVAFSLLLLAIGWTSVLRNHGLTYGIDFKGGTLVYVRFSNTPPTEQIRKGLADAGLPNSTIKPISDISDPYSKNDIVIGLEQKGQSDEDLDTDRVTVLNVLQKTMGTTDTRTDFNAASPAEVALYLTQKDPLALGTGAGDRYTQLAQRLVDARNTDNGGIVTNFDSLKNVQGVTPAVLTALSSGFSLANFTIRNVDVVG